MPESFNSALNGIEVGQHSAEPARVDIRHTATSRFLTNGVLRLLFCAYKEDFLPVGGQITDEHIGFFEFSDRLLEVDDVDPVSFRKNIRSHFGVPPSGLMSEMDTGFKQLFHGYD